MKQVILWADVRTRLPSAIILCITSINLEEYDNDSDSNKQIESIKQNWEEKKNENKAFIEHWLSIISKHDENR